MKKEYLTGVFVLTIWIGLMNALNDVFGSAIFLTLAILTFVLPSYLTKNHNFSKQLFIVLSVSIIAIPLWILYVFVTYIFGLHSGGVIGKYISLCAVKWCFGISAILIPIALLNTGVNSILNSIVTFSVEKHSSKRNWAKYSWKPLWKPGLAIIVISSFFAVFLPTFWVGLRVPAAGLFMTSIVEIVEKNIGKISTIVIESMLLIVWMIFVISDLMKQIRKILNPIAYIQSKTPQTKNSQTILDGTQADKNEKVRDNTQVLINTDKRSENTSVETSNSTTSNLPQVLKQLVEDRGHKILEHQYLVNILGDYQVFKDNHAFKAIIKTLQEDGSMKKLIETSIWNTDSLIISHRCASFHGYRENLVGYVIQCIGYSMSKCENVSGIVISERQDSKNAKIPYPTQRHSIKEFPVLASNNSKVDYREPFTRYQNPAPSLLDENLVTENLDINEKKMMTKKITDVFESYRIAVKEIQVSTGPTFSVYVVTLAPNVHISNIKRQKEDLVFSLAAIDVIIPNKGNNQIHIVVPNKNRKVVSMRCVLESSVFQETKYDLPLALGKDINNNVVVADLAKMPQLLIVGATGQGKSVCLNTIITSLLYKKHPNELKLVLIDSKRIEFAPYESIGDKFMATLEENVEEPIVCDEEKTIRTLKGLCTLMNNRYNLLKKSKVRNIKEYNDKYTSGLLDIREGHEFMPYIVTIIDEFSNLILNRGNEFEQPLIQLGQLGKTVGMHFVIATSQPTISITQGINANFPSRIIFRVNSQAESKQIIGRSGAEHLYDNGDMFLLNDNQIIRVQGAIIVSSETEHLVDYISDQMGPIEPMEIPIDAPLRNDDIDGLDPLFEEAAKFIVRTQQGSTSKVQREFCIGYNRAGRLMDQFERYGIIGKAEGAKPREVLISNFFTLERLLTQIKKS